MRVRPAATGDFARVTELLEELGRARVTPETEEACRVVYESELADPEACPLVAEDGDAIVACCTLHFRPRLNRPSPDAWIPDLVVTAAARRRGAGRALLDEARRRAEDRGCWQLTLESGYQRTEAHRMYEAFGMENAGYYFLLPLL